MLSLVNRQPTRASPSQLASGPSYVPRSHRQGTLLGLCLLVSVWYTAGIVCVCTSKVLLTRRPSPQSAGEPPSALEAPPQTGMVADVSPTLLTLVQLSVSCFACHVYLSK